MRKTAVILLAFLLFLAVSCATTQLTEEQANDIYQLVGSSGHLNSIRGFPGSIKMTIRQSNAQSEKPIPDTLLQTMFDAVDKAVDSNRMVSNVSQAIGQKLSAEDVATLLSWYRSETGKRIRRLEEAALPDSAYREQMRMARELLSDTQRAAKMAIIDEMVGETGFLIKLRTHLQVAAVAAWYGVDNPEAPVPLESITSRIGIRIAGERKAIRQSVVINYLYAYRELGDAELDAYIAFCRSPATKKLYRVIRKAISREMSQEIDELIESQTKVMFDLSTIGTKLGGPAGGK